MIKGRNKWSELIKNCPCQKISDLKNIEKMKKDKIYSIVGKTFGDYRIKHKNMSFAEAVITPKVINGRPKKAVSA